MAVSPYGCKWTVDTKAAPGFHPVGMEPATPSRASVTSRQTTTADRLARAGTDTSDRLRHPVELHRQAHPVPLHAAVAHVVAFTDSTVQARAHIGITAANERNGLIVPRRHSPEPRHRQTQSGSWEPREARPITPRDTDRGNRRGPDPVPGTSQPDPTCTTDAHRRT